MNKNPYLSDNNNNLSNIINNNANNMNNFNNMRNMNNNNNNGNNMNNYDNTSTVILAQSILNPEKAKQQLAVEKGKKLFNFLKSAKKWPEGASLEEILSHFNNKGNNNSNINIIMNNNLKEVKKNKNLDNTSDIIDNLRSFIVEYNKNIDNNGIFCMDLRIFDDIRSETIAPTPLPGVVILEAVQIILSELIMKNNGLLPYIYFNYNILREAMNKVCINYRPKLLIALNSGVNIDNERKKRLFMWLAEREGIIRKGALKSGMTWKQVINYKTGNNNENNGNNSSYTNNYGSYNNNFRGGRGRRRGRGFRGRYRSRGRGRGYNNNNIYANNSNNGNKLYGIKKRLVESGYTPGEAQKIMNDSKENNFCIDYNYFTCNFGNACKFKHICGNCGKTHAFKNCDNKTESDKIISRIAHKTQ